MYQSKSLDLGFSGDRQGLLSQGNVYLGGGETCADVSSVSGEAQVRWCPTEEENSLTR